MKDVGEFVKKWAPLLGTVLGGPACRAIGTLVSSVFGSDDDPGKLLPILQSDPDAITKLKELEFKHYERLEEFRAYGDEAAYQIGRLIDPDAVEVRFVKLQVPGEARPRAGSIQKFRTDLKADFDFRIIPVEKLTAAEIEQLQREHIIDWLISNHDGHMKQFLRTQDNRLVGIDKGQLFKFLGDDELSIMYHPNKTFGESEPFYNALC